MPDTPPARPPAAIGPNGLPPEPTASSQWPPTLPTTLARPSRWPTFAILALASIAVGIAVAGWFRPIDARTSSPPTPLVPAFTEQQIADAKASVCGAYKTVRQAAVVNTNRPNPVPGDIIGDYLVSANARLALYTGGDYLFNHLAMEPATPTSLRDRIRSLAETFQELTMNYLAESPDSVLNSLRQTMEIDTQTIDNMCQ